MNPGAVWMAQDLLTGWAVGSSTKNIDFVNSDATHAAKFRVTIFGQK